MFEFELNLFALEKENPATIVVDSVLIQEPDEAADNPDDYYGYAQIIYKVYNNNKKYVKIC